MDADPGPDAVPLPDATLATTYLSGAMEELLDVAASAGEHLNARPAGEDTNSVAALIVHCSRSASSGWATSRSGVRPGGSVTASSQPERTSTS